jgi:hypothetical protein
MIGIAVTSIGAAEAVLPDGAVDGAGVVGACAVDVAIAVLVSDAAIEGNAGAVSAGESTAATAGVTGETTAGDAAPSVGSGRET